VRLHRLFARSRHLAIDDEDAADHGLERQLANDGLEVFALAGTTASGRLRNAAAAGWNIGSAKIITCPR